MSTTRGGLTVPPGPGRPRPPASTCATRGSGEDEERRVEGGRREEPLRDVHRHVDGVDPDPEEPVLDPLPGGHPLGGEADGGRGRVRERQRGVGAVLQEEAESHGGQDRGGGEPGEPTPGRPRDGEPAVVLSPVPPLVPAVERHHDVHGLQRGVAVDAGLGEDDQEEGGVGDAERPAPRALADGQEDVGHPEKDAGHLEGIQRPLLRTGRRA
jgi:hypothetical protein